MKKLDKATFVIKLTIEENRAVTETEFENLNKKKKRRNKKEKINKEIANSKKSLTDNWFHFDELCKKFYFTKAESELTFKIYCEKYNLRWSPIIHTDPKRPSGYHKYDLEITERNCVKVAKKTIFKLEDTMQSLSQCSISNGPDRPWLRIVKDYYDENNNLIGADDLKRTKTDKRLIAESDFYWLDPEISIKDFLIEWELFEDPARENWGEMDILPIAEHYYNDTDCIQQSKCNDKALDLIDPTESVMKLNGMTVIIRRNISASGIYKCVNRKCGLEFRMGIKFWHSWKSYKNHTQACSICKAPCLPEKRSMNFCWDPRFGRIRIENKGKNKQGHMQNECEMCQCKNKDCQLKCDCSGTKSECKCPKVFCKCEKPPPSCSAPKGEKIKVHRVRNRKGKK